MNFQRERVSPDLIDEIRPLAKDHFATVDPLPDLEHKLDTNFYLAADGNGSLRVFTVRDEHRALHGYAVFFVGMHQHYVNSPQAIQDAVYLCPAVRKGWNGVRFLRWCDERLAEEGIQVVHQFSPLGDRKAKSLRPIFKRLGYRVEQVVYAKRLS